VFSLGKEKLEIGKRFIYITGFYRYIRREKKNYDAVLVLMNPIYVVLGGLLWKLWHKKIALWYAHGSVPFLLRAAEKLTDVIFTSTKSGCRLDSKKIRVIGQGIDIEKFSCRSCRLPAAGCRLKIITIGRIAPVKGYETLIGAVEILRKQGIELSAEVVGGVMLEEHKRYEDKLKVIVKEKGLEDIVHFKGAVPNREIAPLLADADLFVNTSGTGSLDKAILEAMASGLPILTCNEALEEVLGEYREKLMFPPGDANALAEKIKTIYAMSAGERQELGAALRKIVEEGHGAGRLTEKMMENLK